MDWLWSWEAKWSADDHNNMDIITNLTLSCRIGSEPNEARDLQCMCDA